jgi:hypothetical protein
MTTKTTRSLFLAAIFALLTFAASLRAAIPPAENLLPSDTLLVITAPDCAALRSAMHESPQWMLWNDPAMKPFHDKMMAKMNETFVGPLEKDLGVKLADFADLPQGQFTFAVTQNGWSGTGDATPGVVLMLDAKDKSDSLKTILAALQKKWADGGKKIRTENVRGIKFSVVSLSSNDIPPSLAGIFPRSQPVSEIGRPAKPAKPGQIVIGQFESLLIVGSSIAAVEPVAAHLTGGSAPSLDDNAVFAADKSAQFRDAPVYYGWFNAKALFAVVSHIPEAQPNPDAPSPMPRFSWSKVLAASGLTGLKSASFAARESHDGSEADFYLSVPESARAGILKMIAADAKDGSAPPFVPADAVKFWRWRLDGQKDWATLQTMLGEISPVALSTINGAIAMANVTSQMKDPDYDLQKNLIGNLGDDVINYQKAAAGTSTADLNSAPTLYLVGAANPDQAVNAMKGILSLLYKSAEPREFQGKNIYSISLSAASPPGSTASVPARSFYYAASSGYIALSTDSSILESYLRNPGGADKPLNQTAGLADAAQHIGGMGNGLFGYENQREIMRAAFTLLKNQAGGGAGLGTLAALPPTFREWMDFSLLPDYGLVSKYFFFSVFNGGVTADGISFKMFAPRPPGLN